MFRSRRTYKLEIPGGTLELGERTLVMGVVNVTPDSFSDGGKTVRPASAVKRAVDLVSAGADIIDIGGESTRPGSYGVTARAEMERVLPVIEELSRRLKIPISLDTKKSEVAEAGVRAGAAILNDVSGLRSDIRIARVAAHYRVPLIVMHTRGTPRTMQQLPPVKNVWSAVEQGLRWSVEEARRVKVKHGQMLIDPGIGFGKTAEQNFEILRGLRRLERFRLPIVIGTSRKSFLGKALGDAPPDKRIWGTAATVTAAILGGAHIVRVHDVEEMAQVARVTDAVLSGKIR